MKIFLDNSLSTYKIYIHDSNGVIQTQNSESYPPCGKNGIEDGSYHASIISLTFQENMSPITVSMVILTTFLCIGSSVEKTVAICSASDEHAPCACRSMVTAINVVYKYREARLEFQEFECMKRENKQRIIDDIIEAKYICYQMRQLTTIYHDIDGAPVNITINRKNGCELRCINKKCKG